MQRVQEPKFEERSTWNHDMRMYDHHMETSECDQLDISDTTTNQHPRSQRKSEVRITECGDRPFRTPQTIQEELEQWMLLVKIM